MQPSNEGTIVNALLNLVIGVVLGCVGQVVTGTFFDALAFMQTLACSFTVGFTLGSFVPVGSLGSCITNALGIEGGGARYVVGAVTAGVVMACLITPVSCFISAGTEAPAIVARLIVPFIASAAVCAVVVMKPAAAVAGKCARQR